MRSVDDDDNNLDLEATARFSAILRPAAPPAAVAEGIGPLEVTFHGFKTAAEAGDVRAAYRVGICLLEGRGCEQDVSAALAWLLRRSPVMLPIPGTSSLEHLEDNTAAAAIE